MRRDGRAFDQLRAVKMTRRFTDSAPGSVLIEVGRTKVLCTAMVEHSVPEFLENKGRGWVTAEYAMLPSSTQQRKPRERAGKVDGRTAEIQRLVGRSLRPIVDLELLGERTIWVDCDVLEADGGTRTASITGAYVALADCIAAMQSEGIRFARSPLRDAVAAVSVGLVGNQPCLDLCYEEDSKAQVDMNVVMTGKGELVEVQSTAEGKPFSRDVFNRLLDLAQQGLTRLFEIQRAALNQ